MFTYYYYQYRNILLKIYLHSEYPILSMYYTDCTVQKVKVYRIWIANKQW